MVVALWIILVVGFDQLLVACLVNWAPALINSDADRWFGYISTGWSLILAGFILVLIEAFYRLHIKRPAAFVLITAGVFSNTLSYLFYGKIMDFIPMPFTYTNTADLLIVLGCGMVLFSVLKEKWLAPTP